MMKKNSVLLQNFHKTESLMGLKYSFFFSRWENIPWSTSFSAWFLPARKRPIYQCQEELIDNEKNVSRSNYLQAFISFIMNDDYIKYELFSVLLILPSPVSRPFSSGSRLFYVFYTFFLMNIVLFNWITYTYVYACAFLVHK